MIFQWGKKMRGEGDRGGDGEERLQTVVKEQAGEFEQAESLEPGTTT